MKRSIFITLGIILGLVIVVWIFFGSKGKSAETLEVQVKSGEFKIAVTTSGELEAKKSEKIYGPDNLNNVRIWEVKIEDIVPEKTMLLLLTVQNWQANLKTRNWSWNRLKRSIPKPCSTLHWKCGNCAMT